MTGSVDEYVEKACTLVADKARLSAMRGVLCGQVLGSELCEGPTFGEVLGLAGGEGGGGLLRVRATWLRLFARELFMVRASIACPSVKLAGKTSNSRWRGCCSFNTGPANQVHDFSCLQ